MAAYNSHTGRGNNYTTNNQEVRSSYARMTSPDVAPEGPSPGKPVFVMNQDIPGERNVDLQDMYKALCKSVDTKNIVGVQRIGGLWRLYIAERELRIKLITEGLQIRNASVRVYDKNPYLLHENENAVRVVIKDVPLSVHESVIRDGLESANCKIYGPITYPKLRVDGKLTQCLTGDRAVYIDPPPQPLPRYMHFHSLEPAFFTTGNLTLKLPLHARDACKQVTIARNAQIRWFVACAKTRAIFKIHVPLQPARITNNLKLINKHRPDRSQVTHHVGKRLPFPSQPTSPAKNRDRTTPRQPMREPRHQLH